MSARFALFLIIWFLSPVFSMAATSEDYLTSLQGPFELSGHQGQVSRVAFLPGSGRLLVSAGYDDKTVRLWDVEARRELDQLELDSRPRDLAVRPDGKTLEVLTNTGGIKTIKMEKNHLGEPKSHWGRAGSYGRLAINANGSFYVIASRDQPVTVWNADKRRRHQSYLGTEDYRAVAFAPANLIFAAADGTNRLALWDLLALEGFGAKRSYEIKGIEPTLGTWELAFSSDGKQLATSHIDGQVTVWQLSLPGLSAKQLRTLNLPQSAFGVVFSPGGELLLASCQDGSVHLWESGSGKPVKNYPGGVGSLLTLALSNTGAKLVAGSLRGKIVGWQK